MRTFWHAAAVVMAMAMGIATPAATAVPCAWCATEFTQVMNNIELLGVNATQAQALANQFRQLELQLRNAQKLDDPRQVLQVTATFQRLVRVIETSRGASVHAADVDARYREEYGGFDGVRGAATADPAVLAVRYRAWSDTSHENIRAALRAAGLHAAAFYDEEATLRALERRAVGADGMLKVTQAGAQIAAMQVEEGRKLRALLMAQMQMQGNLAAVETERRANADAALDRLRRRDDTGIRPRPVGIDDLRR